MILIHNLKSVMVWFPWSAFLKLEDSFEQCDDYNRDLISVLLIFAYYGPIMGLVLFAYLARYERYVFYEFLTVGMIWNTLCVMVFEIAIDLNGLPFASCNKDRDSHVDDNSSTAMFVSMYYIIYRVRSSWVLLSTKSSRTRNTELVYYGQYIAFVCVVVASSIYLKQWTWTEVMIGLLFSSVNATLFCLLLTDVISPNMANKNTRSYRFCDFMGLCVDKVFHDWPTAVVDRSHECLTTVGGELESLVSSSSSRK